MRAAGREPPFRDAPIERLHDIGEPFMSELGATLTLPQAPLRALLTSTLSSRPALEAGSSPNLTAKHNACQHNQPQQDHVRFFGRHAPKLAAFESKCNPARVGPHHPWGLCTAHLH